MQKEYATIIYFQIEQSEKENFSQINFNWY